MVKLDEDGFDVLIRDADPSDYSERSGEGWIQVDGEAVTMNNL